MEESVSPISSFANEFYNSGLPKGESDVGFKSSDEATDAVSAEVTHPNINFFGQKIIISVFDCLGHHIYFFNEVRKVSCSIISLLLLIF